MPSDPPPADSPPLGASEALLRKFEHQQSSVLDYTRLLASYIPVERLLPLTALRLARGLDIGHTKVLRYDSTHGDLLLEAGVGWRPGAIGTVRFAIDVASPAGRAYQTRLTTLIHDLPNSPEFRYSDFLREHAIVSLVNAPVVSGGVVWGVLEMDGTRSHQFSAGDARFLQVMANILGVAVERAADYDVARATATKVAAAAAVVAEGQQIRLQEMQHRMKNNLAVVSSMLLLEQQQHGDPQVKQRLRGLMDRVGAIAMAHDQLDARPDKAAVELVPYLGQLAGNLALQHSGITVEQALEPVLVKLEQAVPLGLIVNELMTNAAKYAFPNGAGTVRIALRCEPELDEAVLTVSDDGIGLGPPRAGGLGTMLVDGLTGQIGGTVTRPAVAHGTTVVVRFPMVAGPA